MNATERHAVAVYRAAGSLRAAVDVLRAEGITTIGRTKLSELVRLAEPPGADNSQTAPGAGEPITPSVKVNGTTVQPILGPPPTTIADRITEDPRFLPAFRRYVDAIVNDVHPDDALHAARQIDEDFAMMPEERDALHRAVVRLRGDEGGSYLLMAFAEGEGDGEDDTPPDDVVAEQERSSDDEAALSSAILALMTDAYLASINDNLQAIGHGPVREVTDPVVLDRLRADADEAAKEIEATYRADLHRAALRVWRDIPAAERATVAGRQAMADGLRQWAQKRLEWKVPQVLSFQSNKAYNTGAIDFAVNNGGIDNGWYGYVTPDECVCNGCLALVQMGSQPADVMALVDLPLHSGCWHRVEWEYRGTLDGLVWSAQDRELLRAEADVTPDG